MKLFFGGSFNPIHNGHLMAARAAAELIGAEKVVLIPCCDPPHKYSDMLPLPDRIDLIELAIQSTDYEKSPFEVSDIEGRLPGKSYTLNTVRALKQEHGYVRWLIGGDTLSQLPTWHKIEQLVKECEFITCGRPGYSIDWMALLPFLQHLKNNYLLGVPLLDASATNVRKRIRDGLSVRYIVPDAVAEEIARRKFYK